MPQLQKLGFFNMKNWKGFLKAESGCRFYAVLRFQNWEIVGCKICTLMHPAFNPLSTFNVEMLEIFQSTVGHERGFSIKH